MSWVRDIDGDLVNLDHIQRITITPIEAPKETETHALWAYLPVLKDGAEPDILLHIGSEESCFARRDAIAKHLHILRY